MKKSLFVFSLLSVLIIGNAFGIKHYFVKDIDECLPNDYCIAVSLSHVGAPGVTLKVHEQGAIHGMPINDDFSAYRGDNGTTLLMNGNTDVSKNNITAFQLSIKYLNNTALEKCTINHPIINKPGKDTIKIWRQDGQYRCQVIYG